MLAVLYSGGLQNKIENFVLTENNISAIRTLTLPFGAISGICRAHGLIWVIANDHLISLDEKTGNKQSDVSLTWGSSLFSLNRENGLFRTTIYASPYTQYWFNEQGVLFNKIEPILNMGANDVALKNRISIGTRYAGRSAVLAEDVYRYAVFGSLSRKKGLAVDNTNGTLVVMDSDAYTLQVVPWPPESLSMYNKEYPAVNLYNQISA